MPKVTTVDLRRKVMADLGIQESIPTGMKHHRIKPSVKVNPLHHKTPLMKYLEGRYCAGESLESVLLSGSLSTVAKRLGNEVDVSTISKWITRFNLRYTEHNLPTCDYCTEYSEVQCSQGVCVILMRQEQWNLVLLKQQQMRKDSQCKV